MQIIAQACHAAVAPFYTINNMLLSSVALPYDIEHDNLGDSEGVLQWCFDHGYYLNEKEVRQW